MRAVYHPEAEAELVDAARFYETRVATLGVQFLDAVDKSVGQYWKLPSANRLLMAMSAVTSWRAFLTGSITVCCRIICESWHSSITAAIRIIGGPAWPISSEMLFG